VLPEDYNPFSVETRPSRISGPDPGVIDLRGVLDFVKVSRDDKVPGFAGWKVEANPYIQLAGILDDGVYFNQSPLYQIQGDPRLIFELRTESFPKIQHLLNEVSHYLVFTTLLEGRTPLT
jgi:hypothetical protein